MLNVNRMDSNNNKFSSQRNSDPAVQELIREIQEIQQSMGSDKGNFDNQIQSFMNTLNSLPAGDEKTKLSNVISGLKATGDKWFAEEALYVPSRDYNQAMNDYTQKFNDEGRLLEDQKEHPENFDKDEALMDADVKAIESDTNIENNALSELEAIGENPATGAAFDSLQNSVNADAGKKNDDVNQILNTLNQSKV
jgi:hypothetical protein